MVIMLDDMQAGTIFLKNIFNNTKKRSFADFQIFLKVLEVYGAGYPDDIDRSKYGNR